jgi:sugar phosphate isomerase/epimerase
MISPALPRRTFLQFAAVGAAALVPGARLRAAPKHGLTIGLSQYSLRQLFAQKQLDPLDYPKFARDKFGLTELDLWEGGLPADRLDDTGYLKQLKQRAADAGTNLFLLMAGAVDATGGANEKKKAKARPVDHPRSIERAATLGCPYVRLFLTAADGDRAAAVRRSAETLAPLADFAKSRGVTIALEPGSSNLTKEGAFLAEVMQQLKHPHCRLMPDFGKLSGDVYEGTRAMMPHAVVVSAKTHDFDAAGNQIEWDYFRLMKIIADAGFRGIVAIEYEGKNLAPVEGVLASKRLIERALARL